MTTLKGRILLCKRILDKIDQTMTLALRQHNLDPDALPMELLLQLLAIREQVEALQGFIMDEDSTVGHNENARVMSK